LNNLVDEKFDDFTHDDDEELRQLIRSIQVSQKYFLHFAVCNDSYKQNELIQKIADTLPDKKIEVIKFTEPKTDLLGEIIQRLGERKVNAIFVQGLSHSIKSDGRGKENQFIHALNVSRDTFGKMLSCPMYLWLPEYAFVKIARNAPDFFSVRSGSYYFSNSAEEVTKTIFQQTLSNQFENYGLNLAEKKARIKTLKGLLAEYQGLPLEKRDKYAEVRLLHQLTEILFLMAEYDKAIEYGKKALEVSQSLGEATKENAESYNNLAILYELKNRDKEAETLHKRALAIREKILGENHFDTATSYNNLAGLYYEQGKYEEAETLYKKALEIFEKVLGKNHPKTATSYNNLASLYYEQGKYEEAETLYKKSLAIREKVLGHNHPDTASSYNNIAWLYQSKGEYLKAKDYFEKALAIRQNILGNEHPWTVGTQRSLEIVKRKLGE
jgi:tetratricopeptide (TPR) repeat protein